MNKSIKLIMPQYVKFFFILSNVVLSAFVIISMNFIISPLLAAAIVAILIKPLETKIAKSGAPRVLSTTLAVFLFFLIIFILIDFFTTQLSYIIAEPHLLENLLLKINQLEKWISRWFDLSRYDQFKFSSDSVNSFIKNIAQYFPSALMSTASYISMVLLFFLSLFFFVYYHAFFKIFIYKLFRKSKHSRIKKNINKINEAVQNYIVGLFIIIVIVSVLNSTGLLLVGINHAIFFGILGSILTIIPYIGILIGALIPAIYALLTTHSLWYPLATILVFSFVQALEGNFITPIILGRKENINPYIAILGLFIGGMLLGAVGMILAIPLLGIIKIICDDISALKPVGFVMGNPKTNHNNLYNTIKNLLKKLKK
jgi:predicted PurR-regulated permease PerM